MLTVKNTFKLYDVVNKYYQNDGDSRMFISEIEEIMDNKIDLGINDFATRKDFNELRSEVTVLRSDVNVLRSDVNELRSDFIELRSEVTILRSDVNVLRSDVNELRSYFTELRSDFSRLESGINLNLVNSALMFEKMQKEQIKWLVGTMVAISGLAVTIVKFF